MLFGSLVCTVNGNMFTGVHQDNLFIRLSEQDRQDILEAHDEVAPFHRLEGCVMKEYAVLPESLIRDAASGPRDPAAHYRNARYGRSSGDRRTCPPFDDEHQQL